MSSILLIEDDEQIASLVKLHLADSGLEVLWVADGEEGLRYALTNDYQLIILDLMLPSLDGIEVCKRIRSSNSLVPILMLTAKGEEFDKVLGLELGADDYVTKPFSVRELMARVRALLRRIEIPAVSDTSVEDQPLLRCGDLTVDRNKRKVSVDGKAVDLTAKEYALLAFLLSHPGRPFSRNDLLSKVWGYNFDGYEHTVNSHINRLRGKIEIKPSEPRYILTVWGVGYRFAETQELAGGAIDDN